MANPFKDMIVAIQNRCYADAMESLTTLMATPTAEQFAEMTTMHDHAVQAQQACESLTYECDDDDVNMPEDINEWAMQLDTIQGKAYDWLEAHRSNVRCSDDHNVLLVNNALLARISDGANGNSGTINMQAVLREILESNAPN